jgi:hypothetical protein
MEKLVKPNPKKEKEKTTTTTTQSFAKPPLSKSPPQDCTTQALPNHKQRDKNFVFHKPTKDQIPRTLELHMKKRREGASKKKKMYPPNHKKSSTPRPKTHSLTHSLTPKGAHNSSTTTI